MSKMNLLVLPLSLLALSAHAANWSCHELTKLEDVGVDVARPMITVQIEEKEDITKKMKSNYDSVKKVRVLVESTLGRISTTVKDFQSIATTEDVSYEINDESEGVKFWIFLDELEQSGIELKIAGRKKTINLTCSNDILE